MSECSRCGHTNPEGSDFCAECGQFLDWDPPAGGSRTPARPGPAVVVPVAGPDASPEALEAVEEAQRAADEAERIRIEAEARAARESVAAVRTAEETVHRIRSEVLARVESVAPSPDGSPPPEGAAAAAAAAAEQAEAEAAERRAALEVRKARELAHRRARAEAAEADQRARDAASRAAALVARPVAAPDPTITLDRATGLATTPASPGVRPQSAPAVAPGAPAVQAVQAVRPGAERAPAVVAAQGAAPDGPVLRSGEIPCRDCGGEQRGDPPVLPPVRTADARRRRTGRAAPAVVAAPAGLAALSRREPSDQDEPRVQPSSRRRAPAPGPG